MGSFIRVSRQAALAIRLRLGVVVGFVWGLFGVWGVRGDLRWEVPREICGFKTNHQNPGLISVDRRTSLLSHLQYPVLYQSRLQRI